MYEDENMIYDINSLSLSIPSHPTNTRTLIFVENDKGA